MQKLHISKTHSSSFSQHIFIHDHCCTCVCVSEEEYGVLILHTSHVIDLLEVLVKALIVVSTQSGSSCSCTCEPPSASDSACQSNPLPLAGHSLRLTDHTNFPRGGDCMMVSLYHFMYTKMHTEKISKCHVSSYIAKMRLLEE